MPTETPEIDTHPNQAPASSDQPHPGLAETAIAWVQVAGLTAVANIVIYAVAVAAGAEMTADLGMFTQAIGPTAIVAATFGTLAISTFVWALVAHRVPAFAHLWVPLGWGVGLVSLGAILGTSGAATAIGLTVIQLLTTAVAAHLIPRRLPR